MEDELRNRLDALEIAMRHVTGELARHGAFATEWAQVCDRFILELPDDQAHRGRAIREAYQRLRGPTRLL